jgi:hypothetical protein
MITVMSVNLDSRIKEWTSFRPGLAHGIVNEQQFPFVAGQRLSAESFQHSIKVVPSGLFEQMITEVRQTSM